MSLSHRQNNVLAASASDSDDATFADSYTVTVEAIGAVAAAASSGSTATVDAGHGFAAGDKVLIWDGTTATFVAEALNSVTGTTLVWSSATPSISSGDLLVNLGADTASGATPAYDASKVKIYSDADAGTAISNSRVTTDSQGNYDYYHKGDGRMWELIRDSSGTVAFVIDGYGGVAGRFNVADMGAALDGSTDDAGAFAVAITASNRAGYRTLYIPTGTMVLSSKVTLVSNLNVECAPGAIIQGSDGTETLFDLSGVGSLTWRGGRFTNAARAFDATGNSSTNTSHFIDMWFYGGSADNLGRAFSFESVVGCVWARCVFGDATANGVTYGVYLAGTGTGGTNLNTFNDCKFFQTNTAGIILEGTQASQANKCNDCWFEDSTGDGVLLTNTAIKGFRITGGWMENLGSATKAAIRTAPASGAVLDLIVSGVHFASPATGSTEYIDLTGHNFTIVRECHFVLDTNGGANVAVRMNSNSSVSPSSCHLLRNYVNNSGTSTTYPTILYSTAGQNVVYEVHSASGNVTSDENPDTVVGGGGLTIGGIFDLGTESGITASSTQSQGQQPLTKSVNEVDTVGTTGDVVTLPTAAAGRVCVIINNGANALGIFPASGDDAGAGANTRLATDLPASDVAYCYAYDATNWAVTFDDRQA